MKDYIELEEKYLKNPNDCPFCGSSEIVGGEADFSDRWVYRDVECYCCGKTWTEEFKMSGITIKESDLVD